MLSGRVFISARLEGAGRGDIYIYIYISLLIMSIFMATQLYLVSYSSGWKREDVYVCI